jgi:thiol:disulfide interchange protein DsbC
MNILKPVLISLLLLSVGGSAIALGVNDTSSSKKLKTTQSFDAASLKNKLSNTLGINASHITASPMPGVAEVVTEQGLIYVSYDGSYILQGKLYGLGDDIVNYTEESLAKVRVEGVKNFADGMITYPAKNEKHVVTIFTDITCGYCRKLHEQMDEYNDLGITVKYLAYPRSGVKDQTGDYSQGFKDLQSIWCHEKPEEALTKAKNGSGVAQRICKSPVEAEFNFGRQVGVSGTPAIIFENGMMIPGYQPPQKLAQILNSI